MESVFYDLGLSFEREHGGLGEELDARRRSIVDDVE